MRGKNGQKKTGENLMKLILKKIQAKKKKGKPLYFEKRFDHFNIDITSATSHLYSPKIRHVSNY